MKPAARFCSLPRLGPVARARRCGPAVWLCAAALLGLAGCSSDDGAGAVDASGAAADASAAPRAGFPDRVVRFEPGEGAGFGAAKMPGVVLGPPAGGGAGAGSLDVVSLGRQGLIELAFDDEVVFDGPGPDLIVFENAFSTWLERGEVSVSADGVQWHTFPCAADDAAGGFPGCAGVTPVLAHPDNGVDPHDPAVAGGDAFDLATLGLDEVRFVRVRDAGSNDYGGPGGGFDLDAVAAVHWR